METTKEHPAQNEIGPDKTEYDREQLLLELRLAQEDVERLKNELAAKETESKERQSIIDQRDREIHELSFDSVTDLKIRSLFYRKIGADIERHMKDISEANMDDWEKMSMSELIRTIETIDPKKIKDIPMTIAMGDVAFLSLANTDSHDLGDELLRKIGISAKKSMETFPDMADFFRYGGDEIIGIFRTGNAMAAKHMAETFQSEVKTAEFPYLRSLGIASNLHIDIGTSGFSEGIKAFKDLLIAIEKENTDSDTSEKHPINIHAGERLRTFIDLWVGIADEKSILNKAEKRIPTLKFYKEYYPEVYANIIDTLRKGALGITDTELDELPDDTAAIKRFILDKRAAAKNNDTERKQRQKILSNIIISGQAEHAFLETDQ